MDKTVRILSLLENTKFSANNDLVVLHVALALIYTENKPMFQRGSRDRELLQEISAGKLVLDSAAYTAKNNLNGLVSFLQGLLILAISLINGIGRSPISVQRKNSELKVKLLNKPSPINLTLGKYDNEMGKLVREFKNLYYGRADSEAISKNELFLIKETFRETINRLKNEKKFIDTLEKDPYKVFSKRDNINFTSGLFLVLSALPVSELNNLMINIGSYLPEELEEVNEDMFRVKVRNYFASSSQEMHELFKKIRLLLKLYFGKQREIISIIVKEKTKDLFKETLQNADVKKQVQDHLASAAENQFALRITALSNLVRIL